MEARGITPEWPRHRMGLAPDNLAPSHTSRHPLLKSFALAGTIMLLTLGNAQAQDAESACSTPGSLALADFPISRASIIPSVARQLANIGITASRNNCEVVVTCVARTSATQSQQNRRNR